MPEHQQIQQSKKPDTIFQKQTTPISQTPISNPYSIIQRAKINPKSLTHADVMQLQRTIGNRAVAQLLSGIVNSSTALEVPIQRSEIPEEEEKPMQGKFEAVQRSENPEEEELLQGKMVGTVQRQEIPEEEPPMQGKFESIQRQEAPEDEEPLQGKFEDTPEIACPSCFAAPIMQRQELEDEEKTLQGKMIETIQRQEIPEEEPLQTKRENNTGMPDNLKAGVENLSGIDMSDVRVHYNSDKPAEVGALAYTQGTDIHVAPGQERHLPHEAWHVVQQAQGRVRPTIQMKGMEVNDDIRLEQEANIMGGKAIQYGTQQNSINKLRTTIETNTLQMKPAATEYKGTDDEFVNEVTQGKIVKGGQIEVSKDEVHHSVLIAIPFAGYGCQIHIHYKRNLTEVVGSILSNDRSSRHWLKTADAMGIYENCVPIDTKFQAERILDEVIYGHITEKNKTVWESLHKGDYK